MKRADIKAILAKDPDTHFAVQGGSSPIRWPARVRVLDLFHIQKSGPWTTGKRMAMPMVRKLDVETGEELRHWKGGGPVDEPVMLGAVRMTWEEWLKVERQEEALAASRRAEEEQDEAHLLSLTRRLTGSVPGLSLLPPHAGHLVLYAEDLEKILAVLEEDG